MNPISQVDSTAFFLTGCIQCHLTHHCKQGNKEFDCFSCEVIKNCNVRGGAGKIAGHEYRGYCEKCRPKSEEKSK